MIWMILSGLGYSKWGHLGNQLKCSHHEQTADQI